MANYQIEIGQIIIITTFNKYFCSVTEEKTDYSYI